MRERVDIRVCGRIEFDDALRAMRLHAQALRQGTDGDALLLVEHPPVFTLGRGAKPEDILATSDDLERRGIQVHETDRGGEVTWHGPGQLVAYPMVDLSPDRRDVRKYVRALEQVMLDTCAGYGLEADRLEGFPGVWVRDGRGDRKIGAVGVHLSHWISTHGLALNVAPDLSHYGLIVPCGIRGKGVTSLDAEGVSTTWDEAAQRLGRAFGGVFGVQLQRVEPELSNVQVVVLREDGLVLVMRRTMERGGFWQTVTGRMEPGESPEAAAARELGEETGAATPVRPLGYVHDFPLDPGITRRQLKTVKWAREYAFWTLVPASFECRRAPREHDRHDWLTPAEAAERLPYEGLREALRRAVAARAVAGA